MPVRGRQDAVYYTDGGTGYRVQVDSDRFLVADFGWTAPVGSLAPLPRAFTARYVEGISATTQRRGRARVPDVTQPIWTGAATTFDVEATDQTLDTLTVTRRIAERPSLP